MPGARTRKAERRAGIWTLVLLVRFSAPGNLPSALSYRTCRFCCRRPATLKEQRGRMEVSDELVVCVCARVLCFFTGFAWSGCRKHLRYTDNRLRQQRSEFTRAQQGAQCARERACTGLTTPPHPHHPHPPPVV